MSSAAFQPRLRLVGGDFETPETSHAPLRLTSPEAAVIKENRLAAHAGDVDSKAIDPRDPRWVLAMQTQARLQGTMLTPERRDELMASGKQLGLRPFESNLVIAVVQDRARQEQPNARQPQTFRLVEPTPGLIGVARDSRSAAPPRQTHWRWLIILIASAMVVAAIAMRWLIGA